MKKSILARTKSGEIQITVNIPASEIKKAYEKILEEIVKEIKIPGFRKGKAPKKIVEGKIEKSKIYERVLRELIPQFYAEAIKEHNLNPIITPKIEILKMEENKDWEIRITTCEEPEVELGNYREEIKRALSPTKIWTPKKSKDSAESEDSQDEKIQKVIEKLLEVVKIALPEILVENEVNRALSNLINQTNNLGITIDQYLSSIGKSAQALREEYRKKAIEQLTLQFALDKIAEKEKIEVPESEIDDLIKAVNDENLKENFNNPFQRSYLKGILKRRKVLDFLAKF
jgi:FKBP-type peptidyl-prolyl cis-trans isomerase (trigger factor)